LYHFFESLDELALLLDDSDEDEDEDVDEAGFDSFVEPPLSFAPPSFGGAAGAPVPLPRA